MDDKKNNTKKDLGYIDDSYQFKLFHLLLTNQELGTKYIEYLETAYFSKVSYKKLFNIIKGFGVKYGYLPSIKIIFESSNILEAINTTTSLSEKDAEELNEIIKLVYVYNSKLKDGEYSDDTEFVIAILKTFIKQQLHIKLGSLIFESVEKGTFEQTETQEKIQELQAKIEKIDIEDDQGQDAIENYEDTLKADYRNPIPTGDYELDKIMNGGLGEGEMGFVFAPTGVGKAQPLYSKILTPSGWKTMADININDYVISSNGQKTKVLGVFPQTGLRDVYKVKFNDDTETQCDIDHIWSVNTLNMRCGNSWKDGKRIKVSNQNYKEMTLKEILKTGLYKRRYLNYRIPVSKPIHLNKQDVDIHPYLLGCLLGDGQFKRRSITTTDIEIIENIRMIYPHINVYARPTIETNKQIYEISLLKFSKYLNKYFENNLLSHNKYIPVEYLYNDLETRISLLQGLIDTDGYIDKRGICTYSTTSIELANNVRELVLSLGGFSKIKQKVGKYKDKNQNVVVCKTSYIVSISMTDSSIKISNLKRKLDRFKTRDRYSKSKFIKEITYIGKEETKCIYVEDPLHQYITDDYIVTHNTTVLSIFANNAQRIGKNVLYIFFEDKYKDLKRKHYSIWSKIPLSDLSKEENREYIINSLKNIENDKSRGILKLIKIKSEGATIPKIKKFIIEYQKRHNIKFDIVFLDYIDCVESHIQHKNELKEELYVIKAFESMLDDLNIPGWSGFQGNRSSIEAEIVNTNQMGGSIKKAQKTHFLLSLSRPIELKARNKANVAILKSRIGSDGIVCKESDLDNNSVTFKLNMSSVDSTDIQDFISDRKLSTEDLISIKEKLDK